MLEKAHLVGVVVETDDLGGTLFDATRSPAIDL